MPMYNYECECGNKDWDLRSIAERNDKFPCEVCGENMTKSISAAHVRGDYSHKIISDSMAVNIDQIAEHKKQFPDVRITDEGQPVMENYAQHEKYLTDSGFIKPQSKTKMTAVKSNK